jgi:Ca2+-binding RTX toxin-like protein
MAVLTGTPQNDTLVGTSENDTITGLAGSDTIDGGAGADTIDGGDQADIIHGGDGNDILESGFITSNFYTRFGFTRFGDGGGNHVHGDAGDDHIGGGASDWLDGGDGNDRINAFAGPLDSPQSGGAVLITGGDGDDTITTGGYDAQIEAGAGNDLVWIGNAAYGQSPILVSLGTGADTLSLQTGYSDFAIFSHADVTVSDFAAAGVDHDTILYIPDAKGQSLDPFASLLNGGAGKRMGQMGADTVLIGGGSGDVVLKNVTATNLSAANFDGHAFALWTFGTANGETMTGGAGVDHLDGYGGDDVLVGGVDGDYLAGGAGADTFRYDQVSDSNTAGQDVIIDFRTSVDHLDLTALNATAVSLIRSNGATFVFVSTALGDGIIGVESDVNASDIATGGVGVYMIGDDKRNFLLGGAGNDAIDGGAGDDQITGGAGADALIGGAGGDLFHYQAASDSTAAASDILHDFVTGTDDIVLPDFVSSVSLIRSGGATFLFAQTDTGLLQLGSTADINAADLHSIPHHDVYMVGDVGADVLIGGGGHDTIQGNDGADRITGGGSADALTGGAGADTFVYTAASESIVANADTIWDFQSGVDRVDLTAVHIGTNDVYGVAYNGGSAFVFVDLGGDGHNDMLIQLNGAASLAAGDILF